MKRITLVFVTVLLTSSITFAQANLWDGNDFGYDGAFGLTNGSSPDWSTATDIWTIRTPTTNDTPVNLPLGFLELRNPQNTTINVTNSFTGVILLNNGAGTIVTNQIISPDEGVTITGHRSNVPNGNAPISGPALQMSGADDVTVLQEGHYTGGKGQIGIFSLSFGELHINGSQVTGGEGASFTPADAGPFSGDGGRGMFLINSDKIVINNLQTESDTIRGGNAGDDLFGNATAANSRGGAGITRQGRNSEFVLENGRIVGGNGGVIQLYSGNNVVLMSGGDALSNPAGVFLGSIELKQGVLIGGDGGSLQGSSVRPTSAVDGGSGVALVGNTVGNSTISSGVTMQGGSGGSISVGSPLDGVDASGGIGLRFSEAGGVLTVNGASATGGQGGQLSTQGTTVDAVASGGIGVWFSGNGAVTTGRLHLNGGTYTGGLGGTVSRASGLADASGGRGAFFDNAGVATIGGNATFAGGAPGTINGSPVQMGVALEVRDSTVTITNGTFTGRKGLLTSTAGGGGSTSVTILDGSFGDVEFGANNETITISGGTINDFLLSGTGAYNLTLDGTAIYQDLSFAGNATYAVSISNDVSSSGNVSLTAGTATINRWNDSHFANTTVENGGMIFNNQTFNLLSGYSFTLQDAISSASFNAGAVINGNAALNVGFGSITASNFVAQSGAQVTTATDGTPGGTGSITSPGNVVINEGVEWTVDAGASVPDYNTEFVLAQSTSSNLTTTITLDDMRYVDIYGSWLQGISALTNNGTSLVATYGNVPIEYALRLDVNSDYGKAMAELSSLIDTNELDYALISILSRDQGEIKLRSAYVRTPEMANTLIQLPGIVSEQIVDRARNVRRMGTLQAPQGAGGPSHWYGNVKSWFDDHLPSFDLKGAARSIEDNTSSLVPVKSEIMDTGKPIISSPSKNDPVYKIEAPYEKEIKEAFGKHHGPTERPYKRVELKVPYQQNVEDALAKHHGLPEKPLIDIEIPTVYQVWGKAFGTHLEQGATEGFEGYDALVGGAVVGVDKRFNNLLVGLGGGYSHTSLEGDNANDARADTAHGIIYASVNGERSFVDANISYAYNDVKTHGDDFFGYTGKYHAESVAAYVGGGLGFSTFNNSVIITPEASLLTTYYSREDYTEKSQIFTHKEWDAYDEWSYLSSFGATISMLKQVDYFRMEMAFRPELRLHWLHEFNAELNKPSYTLNGSANDLFASLQAREEDLVKVGCGVRFSKWGAETLEFGLNLDAVVGEEYSAITANGTLTHRF